MRYFFFYSFLILYFNAFAQQGTVKDIDGNVYKTVKIGSQVWMAENLKTAHYRDGTPITEIEDSAQWAHAGESMTGAWCYYDSDSGNNPTYGKLYNWYTVADPGNLCPSGWHVPSDHEWRVMTHYLGVLVAGSKMRALALWETPNKGANNSSGFTALPAGFRWLDGTFNGLGYNGCFWSSSKNGCNFAWFRQLFFDDSKMNRNYNYKVSGHSVRCVGD